MTAPRPSLSKLRSRRRARGATMVEYVVLLGFVSLLAAVGIAGMGPSLLSSYQRARGILIAPFP